MKTFTESVIKKDLKNLKYFNNSVKIFETASNYFKKQYELAKQLSFLSKEEMESLNRCIELIDSNKYISQSIELKEKYLNALNKLDEFTKAIIVDAFINDCTYVEISLKMFCSVETVKRRVKSGIEQLVEILNNEK